MVGSEGDDEGGEESHRKKGKEETKTLQLPKQTLRPPEDVGSQSSVPARVFRFVPFPPH